MVIEHAATNAGQYRLLIVAPAGAHLRNFLDRVAGMASAIHIVTSEPLPDDLKYPSTVVDFSLRKAKNFVRTPRAIGKLAAEFRPDVVHVHQLNSVAFFAFKGLKGMDVPVVGTAWGSDVLVLPKKNALMKRMVQQCIRKASALTSDSRHMADVMRSLAHPKKVNVAICNFGVSAPIHDLAKENIIYSNRLHKPLYRIDAIIRAFHKWMRIGPSGDWRLVIAAIGSETPRLKALVDDLQLSEKVSFVGWLSKEDNMEWYAKSKVWVSIPESDATAISLLEAMYHGCYPVVVDLPASREWIRSSEQGRLVADVHSSFFEGLERADFQRAANLNKRIIAEEGSYAVSERQFASIYHNLFHPDG